MKENKAIAFLPSLMWVLIVSPWVQNDLRRLFVAVAILVVVLVLSDKIFSLKGEKNEKVI